MTRTTKGPYCRLRSVSHLEGVPDGRLKRWYMTYLSFLTNLPFEEVERLPNWARPCEPLDVERKPMWMRLVKVLFSYKVQTIPVQR